MSSYKSSNFVGVFSGIVPNDLRRASVVWEEQIRADIEHNRHIRDLITEEEERIIRSDRVCYFYYRVARIVTDEALKLREIRLTRTLTREEYYELYRLEDAARFYIRKHEERAKQLDFSSVAVLMRQLRQIPR